jgi:predicted O-methyltransferase YrrM
LLTGLDSAEELYELLVALVRIAKPEIVVETGTAAGIGTHKIAAALDRNEKGHVWTVDNRECHVEPHDRITVVQNDSLEFVRTFDRQVDFAYVDCAFSPQRQYVVDYLIANGAEIVVLDDAVAYGSGTPNLQFICHGAGLWVWQRPPQPTTVTEPPDWRRL